MSVKENLLAAAEVVENGWCVGHLVQDGDKYCAVGALAKVITGIHDVGTVDAYGIVLGSPEGKALAEFIVQGLPDDDDEMDYAYELKRGYFDDIIYDWNDRQVDKAVVINAMREAASKAE